jgi:hypothetical protein
MKIHLLDGTYELFRNHFGAPPKKAPDGRQVGATLGLVRSLLILLTTPGVTHAARAEQQQSGQDDCAEDWSEPVEPNADKQVQTVARRALMIRSAYRASVKYEPMKMIPVIPAGGQFSGLNVLVIHLQQH